MRAYDRAEEKRIIAWHAERGHIKHYWWDYDIGLGRDDLRPFWQAEDGWNDYIDINHMYKGRLMTPLLRSPIDIIDDLYW
jgi:hypothetical protein